jgi:hypothetical protein
MLGFIHSLACKIGMDYEDEVVLPFPGNAFAVTTEDS